MLCENTPSRSIDFPSSSFTAVDPWREGPAEEASAAPESWEVADLDESVRKLKLSLSFGKDDNAESEGKCSSSALSELVDDAADAGGAPTEEDLNQVGQFLRESVAEAEREARWMEQDVEQFIREKQLEFQQLPTSYLRLAAHHVAQHYSLQSMVLLDNSFPDGSGSKIVVMKSPEFRLPQIRFADILLSVPSEGSGGSLKVAIKQRPQKRFQAYNSENPCSLKSNNSKSVEERKEEYNRARARIFSSSSSVSGGGWKQDNEAKVCDNILQGSAEFPKMEDNLVPCGNGVSSTGGSRYSRTRAETETAGTIGTIGITIAHEIECKDPDFDRSYRRYMERLDPGFGFNGVAYTMQPMLYTPTVNYNTEFRQLVAVHGPHIPSEHQAWPLPQHLPGSWSAAAGVGYGHGFPETMMAASGPNQLARISSAIYPYSTQYLCQRPGIPIMRPQEQMQPHAQYHQLPDAGFIHSSYLIRPALVS